MKPIKTNCRLHSQQGFSLMEIMVAGSFMGVNTQEVEKAFPLAVSKSAYLQDNQSFSVSYPGLVAPLVEAVKELKAIKAYLCDKDPKASLCH